MIISRDDGIDVPDFETRLRIAVDEIVQQQREAGVDIVSDSEQGRVSYVTYIRDPLAGFEGNPSEVPSSDPTLDNHPERGSGDGIA